MRNCSRLVSWVVSLALLIAPGMSFSEEVHHARLSDKHLKVLGFTIGLSTLTEVQQALGKTKQLPRKEQAPNQICYISNKASDGTVLLFEAGPIGGWEQITAIAVFSGNAPFKERSSCASSARVSSNVGTDGGLNLQLDCTRLKALLGEPTQINGHTLIYEFHTRERMTDNQVRVLSKLWPNVKDDPYMDVSSNVEAAFVNSNLSNLTISSIKTY